MLFVGVGASALFAQTPAPIYTWDHAFGYGTGDNLEQWGKDFGPNAITLSNVNDGELTITEDASGTDWAIHDSYNAIRESTPGDYGGLDLTGLEPIRLEIGHSGTKTYGGQFYVNPPSGNSGSGCCDFIVLGGISVNPGAPQVFDLPLSSVAPSQIAYIRSMGVQIFDHTWSDDGAVTWTIKEISSAGTPLAERFLSPHLDNAVDKDGAVVKFDSAGVQGSAGDDTQNGLTMIASDTLGDFALRWVDLGNGPGGAIGWTNGRDGVTVDSSHIYNTAPTDLSNYKYMEVRIRAQGGATAAAEVGVQPYMLTTSGYNFQSPGYVNLPVDSAYHVLKFPLNGITNLNTVQVHGVNIDGHVGGNIDMRVDYVRFRVPEPATLALFALGLVGVVGGRRKR
jgi:hypothetical protein